MNESFPPRKIDALKKENVRSAIVSAAVSDPMSLKMRVGMNTMKSVGEGSSSSSSAFQLKSVFKCLSDIEDAKENYDRKRNEMSIRVKQAYIEAEETNDFQKKRTEFYKSRLDEQRKGLETATAQVQGMQAEIKTQQKLIQDYKDLYESMKTERDDLKRDMDHMNGRSLDELDDPALHQLRKAIHSSQDRLCSHMEQRYTRRGDIMREKDSMIDAITSCGVCYNKISCRVVFPCGHHVCQACSRKMRQCHMCRKPIAPVMNRIVYL